jgi:hypothetical protein
MSSDALCLAALALCERGGCSLGCGVGAGCNCLRVCGTLGIARAGHLGEGLGDGLGCSGGAVGVCKGLGQCNRLGEVCGGQADGVGNSRDCHH